VRSSTDWSDSTEKTISLDSDPDSTATAACNRSGDTDAYKTRPPFPSGVLAFVVRSRNRISDESTHRNLPSVNGDTVMSAESEVVSPGPEQLVAVRIRTRPGITKRSRNMDEISWGHHFEVRKYYGVNDEFLWMNTAHRTMSSTEPGVTIDPKSRLNGAKNE
jgi:hypothetical protein